MQEKSSSQEFWGLGPEFEPEWFLTEEQKNLQKEIIQLCRTVIRPNAPVYDRTGEFPRTSLDAMAQLGLLGIMVPKELGGRGENHVCASMVVETIARYGCPSTAMVYTMHLMASGLLLGHHHDNPKIQEVLRNLDKEKLVGTASLSDPASGGQFWFPLSSKCTTLDKDHIRLLKYGQWATSAGFADWYVVSSSNPDADGDFSSTTFYLMFKDEIRTYANAWDALGMRGNQSGPLVCDGVLKKERIIGGVGLSDDQNSEHLVTLALLCFTACFNGLALAAMDVGKRHVTTKTHGHNSFRVCDYPAVQEYFGESICATTASRMTLYTYAALLDSVTKNCDWSLYKDPKHKPRTNYMAATVMMKYISAKNCSEVTEHMLHACGGAGYKKETGLERLLRDSKAGWLMGPSNELSRVLMGQICLLGIRSVDTWDRNVNRPNLYRELGKMKLEDKKALAKELMQEVEDGQVTTKDDKSLRKEDFDNPFNTCPPHQCTEIFQTSDGNKHCPALNPNKYVSLQLVSKSECAPDTFAFKFALPNASDHLGCLPGQYIQMRIGTDNGNVKSQERFFSPTSPPQAYGQLEIITKLEAEGLVSNAFRRIKPGEEFEFRGPCGGFEYEANTLDHLILICGGVGVTPAIQLVRTVMTNPRDLTKITLFYCSDRVENLICFEELCNHAAKDCRFSPIFVLREAPEGWKWEEGDLDQEKLKRYLPSINGNKTKLLISGGSILAASCLQSLRWLGWPSEVIFIYGPFGTQLLRAVYGRNAKLSSHTLAQENEMEGGKYQSYLSRF